MSGDPRRPGRRPIAPDVGAGLFVVGVAVWYLLERWPAAETAAGGADASAAASSRAVGALIGLIAFLYLAVVSVALARVDLATRRLPDRIVMPGYVVGGALLSASAVLGGDPAAIVRSAVAGAALFAGYATIAFAAPRGMGFGDVKLAGLLGLYLGWLGAAQTVVGAVAGFVSGGLWALALIAGRRAARRDEIPFGPWMLLGAWFGAVFGVPAAEGYLALLDATA